MNSSPSPSPQTSVSQALAQPSDRSSDQPPTPIKVLQVLGGMNPGGVETWLLQVLQHLNRDRMNRDRIQMDFWVHTPQDCLYDPEIRSLGSQIITSPSLKKPLAYAAALRKTLQAESYQVVHSHLHHFSGAVLRVAAKAGVPVRIAHSHLDTTQLDAQSPWNRRLYLGLCQRWINRYATVGLSASGLAAAALFGTAWKDDPRWQILHCGVNLTPFEVPFKTSSEAAHLRASFQIPEDAWVIGHVGRFEPQKNHAFLLQLVAEVLKQKRNIYLFLVGQGSLLPQIQSQAQALGIRDRVIFARMRRDVPQLMQGVMDVLVLPSWQEGLPLVLMEAQAAGLPCVISDSVTSEVEIVPNLIRRCSLSSPVAYWVEQILETAESARPTRSQALEQVKQSTFNIDASVQTLATLYRETARHAI